MSTSTSKSINYECDNTSISNQSINLNIQKSKKPKKRSNKKNQSGDNRSGGGGMNLFTKSNIMLTKMNNQNKLRISSINIRSLNSSIEHLEELMLNKNIDLDILCLQETRSIDLAKLKKIQNHWLLYSYDYSSQYGGTCIMIKNGDKVKRVTFIKQDQIKKLFNQWKDELDKDDQFKGTFKETYFERFSLCKIFTNNNKYLVISLYQYTNDKDRHKVKILYKIMTSIIQSFYGNYKIIIATDLNCYMSPKYDQYIDSNSPHKYVKYLKQFYEDNVQMSDS